MKPIPDNRKARFFVIFKGVLIALLMISSGALAAPNDVRLDLFIELRAPELVDPGDEYTINLSYGNSNTARTPEDTWVEATLPDGVAFVSAEDKHHNPLPPDSIDGNILHWDVGTPIPDWETEHIYILLVVDEELSQNMVLPVSAEIGTSSEEVSYDNNTASVISYTCDMAGSYKQANAYEFMPADVITYTITINVAQGSSQGFRDVTMIDTLPPADQVRFLGWAGEEEGIYDGTQLQWQGRVHTGQPTQLQYRLGIEGDVPPDTALTNQARLHWWDGEAEDDRVFELEPVVVDVFMPENAFMMGPDGGQWQHSYGITLTVPANAVQEITRFQFKPLFEDEPPDSGPPGWSFAHRAFEMHAFQFGDLHQFNQPLEISIQYGDQDVIGLIRDTLRLWHRSGPNAPWGMAAEPVLHEDGLIKFETDHFTEFALFAHEAYNIYLPLVVGE